MSKTELTRKIERALMEWNPATIGGTRVAAFRSGFAALEVPVKCGTTTAGIVDYVRAEEVFRADQVSHFCRLSESPDYYSTEYWDNFVASNKNCPHSFDEIRSERFLPCENASCTKCVNCTQADVDILLTCVEIKISKSDFKSLNGHNLVGNCNFYAIPTALYQDIKGLIPQGVGVLLYTSGGGIRRHVDAKYRTLSDAERLWLLMSVAKRNLKMLQSRQKACAQPRPLGPAPSPDRKNECAVSMGQRSRRAR